MSENMRFVIKIFNLFEHKENGQLTLTVIEKLQSKAFGYLSKYMFFKSGRQQNLEPL